MPSLENTVRSCHPAARGLMNSWVLISGLAGPSQASHAIYASPAVSSSGNSAKAASLSGDQDPGPAARNLLAIIG
jgi:hypothetical protein